MGAFNYYPNATLVNRAADTVLIYSSADQAVEQATTNQLTGLASQPLGLTDTQSPTNKTFNNTNTITIKDGSFTLQNTSDVTKQAVFSLSGLTTGTTRTYTLPNYNATLASVAGTETFTNKTLTSPTISSPTITNATISSDSYAGYTVSNSGSIYGISVSLGQFGATTFAGLLTATTGLTLSGGTLTLPNNSITAANLATTTITLGYAQITTNFTTTTTGAWVDVTSMASTVTVPAGGRNIKITAFIGSIKTSATAGTTINIGILEGSTVLGSTVTNISTTSYNQTGICVAYVSAPTSGSHTYKVSVGQSAAGTLTVGAGTANPSFGNNNPVFILVEAI